MSAVITSMAGEADPIIDGSIELLSSRRFIHAVRVVVDVDLIPRHDRIESALKGDLEQDQVVHLLPQFVFVP
jgi:hypothetical protein